jgi:hypothetical protein
VTPEGTVTGAAVYVLGAVQVIAAGGGATPFRAWMVG